MTPTKHTLEQILQIMTELWSWLADNPECESKRYWPGWNKYAEMTSDCPVEECSGLEVHRTHCDPGFEAELELEDEDEPS